MKKHFETLEKIGRIRLSENFYFRQFLYSEISAAFGILNIPDDLDLAIEVGEQLCSKILEPILKEFGSVVIRSGYRSEELNDFGSTRRLNCALSQSNYAYHIWDRLDRNGCRGASACIVIPELIDMNDPKRAIQLITEFIRSNLNFSTMTFFSKDLAFNIGWHEKPKQIVKLGKYNKYFLKPELGDELYPGTII